MGLTSISIVVFLLVILKPILSHDGFSSDDNPCSRTCLGGRSKWGVDFVRYPYTNGDSTVKPIVGIDVSGRSSSYTLAKL
jgi:hypothetical protein